MYLEPRGLDMEVLRVVPPSTNEIEKDWAHLIQFLTSSDRLEAKYKVEKLPVSLQAPHRRRRLKGNLHFHLLLHLESRT